MQAAPARSIRILIADDSPELRRGLRALIESRPGFKVCGKATDGAEVISQARELKPDLIILDLGLPDMDGFEAARRILQSSPAMPILMFSMHYSTQLVREAHKIGIRGYIEKGSSLDILFQGIEAVLTEGMFFLSKSRSPYDPH